MAFESIPTPPWVLRGEAVAFLAPWLQLRLLVNYHQSPVGPYLEHALAQMTWRGPSVVQMSVNSEASRRGGRENWGYPKTLESLSWWSDGGRIVFSREGVRYNIRKVGLRFPVALPFWTIQELDGVLVRVPARMSGVAQFGFRGAQLALVLSEFEMVFEGPVEL